MKRLLLFFIALSTMMAASASVSETTWKNLSRDIKAGKASVIVVDVYATWCGPCKQYAPIFDKVSGQFPQVKFVRMDIDQNMGITDYIPVTAVPMTIIFYCPAGAPKYKVLKAEGMLSAEDLAAMVRKALSAQKQANTQYLYDDRQTSALSVVVVSAAGRVLKVSVPKP